MNQDSPIFQWTCEALEDRTVLNRLQARGTVRLALRRSEKEADSVTTTAMVVVLTRVLPEELAKRGITDGRSLCQNLADEIRTLDFAPQRIPDETPDEVFERMFGSETA